MGDSFSPPALPSKAMGEVETEGWGAVVDVSNGEEKALDDGKIDGFVPTRREEINVGPVGKFRGIPHDVKLFEVFWHQIVELIKVR